MGSTNASGNLNNNKKQGSLNSNHATKDNNDTMKDIKKDVDEYDLSTEYFTKKELESDGEDF